MTKLRNKLVLVLLALCTVACLGITVACGDDTPEDNSVTYTVTVTAGTAAAEGVQVTVKKGSAILGKPRTTDKDGKATFALAEDSGYTVTLSNLPEGYALAEGATLTFDAERKLTVALVEKFAYIVNLVNPDNTPYYADGVQVGVCTVATGDSSSICLTPVALGANGVAKIYDVEKADYHVQILGLPATAAYVCDEAGYYTGEDFSATETEMSITIYPVIEIGSGKEMTAEEKAAYAENNFGYDEQAQMLTAYKYSGKLAVDETVYYAIDPAISGDYAFYKDYDATYLYKKKEFALGNVGDGLYYAITLEANNRYYIHVSNPNNEYDEEANREIDYEFVITYPAASNTQMTGVGTTTAIINNNGGKAVIQFTPTVAASFKAAVQGDKIAAIKQAANGYSVDDTEFADADYKAESEVSFKFTEDMIGESIYLVVSVKDDVQKPETLQVKIEKLNDLTNTTNNVQIQGTLADYTADQTGKELVPIALTADEAAKIVKVGDKYYYGESGPEVVVNLTGSVDVDRCNIIGWDNMGNSVPGKLVYAEMATNGQVAPYIFDVTTEQNKKDLTKGNTYADYRTVLRGFTDYNTEADSGSQGVKLTIPTTGLAADYYAKHVNADGVYPLNDQLKEYLERTAAEYPNVISFAEPGAEWLFACYYYAEAIEADAIVGEYKIVSRIIAGQEESVAAGDITSDSYKLIVNKRYTFEIQAFNPRLGGYATYADYTDDCTWTKEGSTYSFTAKNGAQDANWNFVDVHFTVAFDPVAGTIVLTGDDPDTTTWTFTSGEQSDVPSQQADPIVGAYAFTSPMGRTTLTVNADGTFTLAESMGSNRGTWGKNVEGPDYTFVMVIDYGDGSDPVSYLYTAVLDDQTGAVALYAWESYNEPDLATAEPEYRFNAVDGDAQA